LKKRQRFKFDQLRQRLILTPAEKRVLIFILAAFFVGLGTKYYRESHSSPALSQSNLDTAPARKELPERQPGAPTATPSRRPVHKSQPP